MRSGIILPQIFISHATANDIQAEALRNHLIERHFAREDVFLDHSVDGIRADDNWQDALASANANTCDASAVLRTYTTAAGSSIV